MHSLVENCRSLLSEKILDITLSKWLQNWVLSKVNFLIHQLCSVGRFVTPWAARLGIHNTFYLTLLCRFLVMSVVGLSRYVKSAQNIAILLYKIADVYKWKIITLQIIWAVRSTKAWIAFTSCTFTIEKRNKSLV